MIRVSKDPQALIGAGLGFAGAVLVTVGAFADWYTITIGDLAAPGGAATGWEGRDGRTVVAGAAICAVAATLVALDSRRLAPRVALVVAGFITAVIAFAAIVDTTGKAEQVEGEFAIPAGRVAAEVGAGLWLVALGSVLELAGGVVAHQVGPRPPEVTAPAVPPRRRSGGPAAPAAR